MSSVWWDRIGADAEVEVATEDSARGSRRATAAIMIAGLVAGTCDLAYVVTFYGVQGVAPTHILQAIASGLLGANSYEGGWASALLGLALHFLIALVAATLYYLASRKLTVLLAWAPLGGALYGVAIYFFMRKVVIPLSAVPDFTSSTLADATDFSAHVFLIGLPIALITRRYGSPLPGQSSSRGAH